MFIKTVDGDYYNYLTGTVLSTEETRAGNEFRVVVRNPQTGAAVVCVQNGYRSMEDAREALDTLMDNSSDDVFELDVPDYSDEDSEVDSDEDSDQSMNYESMSNSELRAEITKRNEDNPDLEPLPTTGKNADLVARLRADDDRQSAEVNS